MRCSTRSAARGMRRSRRGATGSGGLRAGPLIPGGVKPGGKLYLNIMRISGPNVGNTNGFGLDTWVSYCTVHEVDRLGEVRLGE